MIRFAMPLLLALSVPLIAIVAWRLRRLPVEHAGLRRRLIQACVLLASVAAALALAGLEVGSRVDRMAVVFVLDRSRSVERAGEAGTAEALGGVRRALDQMDPDDKAGLVVFGAEAATEVVVSPSPPIGPARASVPREATDIAAGIRRALADLPAEHAGRVVLISDGVQTQGDAIAAAASAASRGVAVDVVPVERAPRPEIAVDRVRLPRTADPGEPIELRIVTRATRATRARIRVTRNDEVIASSETSIAAGDDVLVMRDVAPDAGVHRYDVLIEPSSAGDDASAENNEGGAFLRVTGGSRVLLLAGQPEQATALAEAIRRGGLEVDLFGPERVPTDLGSIAGYDLLVLSDVNARRFTEDQMRIVASYVRDLGGGLLMVGVRDSFGLGGYAHTPIEEVLPATFDLRQRRDRASLAMVIAIDNSGSMGAEVSSGRTKLDLANEAAGQSAMLLSSFDRIGVMHVDTEVGWTLPMTGVSNPRAVADAIRRAQPGGGGIFVDITLAASYGALMREQAQLKHLLLFSDGEDSENMEGTRRQVDLALRQRHITTSIVSMGSGVDTPELEHLSRVGGGRFYIVDNLAELPRIFTQETIEASRSAIVEELFRPTVGAPGAATRGIDFTEAPALGGYVVVNGRPRATRLLGAKGDDALLLAWQHGIGRAAVFAADAGDQFVQPWLSWPGYGALFAQLARDLSRSPERRDAVVAVSVRDGVGRVRVEAVDDRGRYRNYLDLSGTVAAPGGRRLGVPLAQTGAGRYEGTFDAKAPGPYLVTVREGEQGMVGSAGVVRASGDELRGEGTDHATLGQIAALTGGVIRRDLRAVFTDRPAPTWAYRPVWSQLILWALLLMLMSVAMRRLVLPADLIQRMVPQRLRRAFRVRAPRPVGGADPGATLAALAAARRRGTERRSGEVAEEELEASPMPPTTGQASLPSGPALPSEPPQGQASASAGNSSDAPSSLAEKLLERRKRRPR